MATRKITAGREENCCFTPPRSKSVSLRRRVDIEVCRFVSVVAPHSAGLLVSVLNIDGRFWRWTEWDIFYPLLAVWPMSKTAYSGNCLPFFVCVMNGVSVSEAPSCSFSVACSYTPIINRLTEHLYDSKSATCFGCVNQFSDRTQLCKKKMYNCKRDLAIFVISVTFIRDRSVGIATRYRLDGPGIESRWRRDFSHTPRPALGPTQPPIQWVPGLFPVDKAAGAWRWPPTSI